MESKVLCVFGHVRAVAADKDVRFFAEDQVAHFLFVFGEFVLDVDFFSRRVLSAESGDKAGESFVFDESEVGFVQVVFVLASTAEEEPGFPRSVRKDLRALKLPAFVRNRGMERRLCPARS